jgi:hypothetical protein
MARECAVCTHPEVRTLDQQLASGAAVTFLARKYDLSEQAITEHAISISGFREGRDSTATAIHQTP